MQLWVEPQQVTAPGEFEQVPFATVQVNVAPPEQVVVQVSLAQTGRGVS